MDQTTFTGTSMQPWGTGEVPVSTVTSPLPSQGSVLLGIAAPCIHRSGKNKASVHGC